MLPAIELAAVVSAAIYGILRANRQGFDAVGVIAIAFATAFGGGTLRDLFLDRHPLFWIEHAHYVTVVVGLALLGAMAPRGVDWLAPRLAIPDALGLGLFSIVGASAALEAGTSLLIASLLGVVTGTFGGVIADVICNEVPNLFRRSPLYATCAFVGAWVYLLLALAGEPDVGGILGVSATVALRLMALRWDWQVPIRSGETRRVTINDPKP